MRCASLALGALLVACGSEPSESDPYRALVSRTAGVALERQLHLADVVGERPWQYEVDSGELTFGTDLSFHAEILGTESTTGGTWLWSWANVASDLPPAATRVARRLRERGRRDGIAELRDAELSLDRVTGHELAMIAVGLGEGFAYYNAPHEGGAVLLVITDRRFPALPDPELARWSRLLAELPTSAEIDHRAAYEALFRARGFEVTSEGSTLRARRSGVGEWTLTFDERGRMTQLEGGTP